MARVPSHPHLHRLTRLAAALTFMMGSLVLGAWLLGIPEVIRSLPTMKANTAIAFMAAGGALWLHNGNSANRHIPIIRFLAIVLVLGIGALTLLEYFGGWDLGIDQLIVRDLSSPPSDHAGRMSPLTAINLVLLGGSLLCLNLGIRYRTAQGLTIIALGLSLLACIGYLYGVASLYRVTDYSAMAPHTAITFLCLGSGLLATTADQGWMRLLVNPSAGGVLARRLIPAALGIPPLIGWLFVLGQRAALYDASFGMALFVLTNMIVFTTLILHSAAELYRLDRSRSAAEAHLRHLSADLEMRILERTTQLQAANDALSKKVIEHEHAEAHTRALLEAAPDAIVIIDRAGLIRLVNAQVEKLFGYSRDALLHQSVDLLVPDRFRNGHFGHRNTYFQAPNVRSMGAGNAFFARRQNGTEFPVEIILSPIETADGMLVAASIRDVTTRIAMEDALRTSEAKLRTLFEVLPVGISILDGERRIVDTNPALGRILRLAPASLDSNTYPSRTFIHPDGSPIPPEDMPSIRAAKEQQPILDKELGVVLETGHVVWTSVSAAPLPGPDHGVVIVTTDITARVAAEHELQHVNRKLTQRIDQLTILNQLAEQVQLCVAELEVYHVAAALLGRLFPGAGGALYRINNSQNRVETVLTWGAFVQSAEAFGLHDCWALRRGQLYATGAEIPAVMCHHIPATVTCMTVCIPLLAQGEAQGLFHLRIPEGPLAGAFDAIQQHVAQVAADNMALALANVKLRATLHQQSIRDALTGLFNRRYMQEAGERELSHAMRTERALGIIMLDVDHFKRINDTYGHEVGDRVLRQLGRFLRDATRSHDIACRYGGEEFVLILPETILAHTQQRAEELRLAFKALALQTTNHVLTPITLSFGVAAYPSHGGTLEMVLKAADTALYEAKHRGRDQVVVATISSNSSDLAGLEASTTPPLPPRSDEP